MKKSGAAVRRMLVAASVLCALLAAREAPAAYPPAGSPAPEAPCARGNPSPALDFFCRFFTLELWQKAGQPEYLERGGKRWQAWFYGKEGPTNQLLVEGREYLPEREGWFEALFDVADFDAETYEYFWDLFRYAPWSVQFLHAGGCRGGEWLDPAALAGGRFQRRHVLGLGWTVLADDLSDPSRGFGAALPLLLPLARLGDVLEPALRTPAAPGAARADLNAFAAGQGRLWPDYARDGGVWLVGEDGAVTALDDLEDAARRFAAHGRLLTNDAMRSWQSGLQVAQDVARRSGPLLFIYFAQDPFLPVDPAGAYSARLDYLLARAEPAPRAAASRVLSHGRSAAVVARALADRPDIVHESRAPAASPLDAAGYSEALRRAIAAGRIDIAATDPSRTSGRDTAAPDCLGPAMR